MAIDFRLCRFRMIIFPGSSAITSNCSPLTCCMRANTTSDSTSIFRVHTPRRGCLSTPFRGDQLLKSIIRLCRLFAISIDEGFYVQLMADEYFLPHTPFYEKIHNPHAIMVFGYDDDTETLETLGFNRARDYAVSRVGYSDFEAAFRWIDPEKRRSYRIDLFEYNEDGVYEFDIDAVIDQLRAYVHSENSSIYYRTLRKPVEGVFGMATYKLLRDYFTHLFVPSIRLWDRRHLFTLWEHKRCMLNRLAYLEERGYLRPSDQFHQAYKEVEQKAHQIHLMMLKLRA